MKAAVIGTGMMGPRIAMTLTLAGVETVILGRTAARAEAGLVAARRQLALLAANDLVTPQQVAFSPANLRASASLEAEVADADLVVASGPEN